MTAIENEEPKGTLLTSGDDPIAVVGTSAVAPVAPSPYRWVILLLCFLVMTTSFTVRIAWANAATKVSGELGLNATMLGSFVTAFFAGYVVTNAIGGFAADKYGAKRMMTLSLVPLAILVGSFGLIRSYPMGLLIQLGMGLSAGIDYAATTKLAAAWFPPAERGRCFGVLSAASSTSLIFANVTFPSFIDAYSWHSLYFLLGTGTMVMALICLLGLRDAPPSEAPVAGVVRIPVMTTVQTLISDRNFMFLALAWFGGLWGTWGVTFWGNALMVKGHGLSNIAAGGVTTLLGIGGFIAKPTYGWLSDVVPFRRKIMVAPCFLGFAITLVIFGTATTLEQFRLIAPILGVFAFVYSPLTTAMMTEIIGKRQVGAASGLMNAFTQTSTIIAPVVVGYVFQTTHSFLGAFFTLALGPLVSTMAILMVREPARRRADDGRAHRR